jgi:hypothetical protein
MRPSVCRCYIQWLGNVCAACGTYVVNWMYFIISEQMVIIYILRLFSQLWCVIVKEENVFRCQFILWWCCYWCYNDTWKFQFSLTPFCKSAGRYRKSIVQSCEGTLRNEIDRWCIRCEIVFCERDMYSNILHKTESVNWYSIVRHPKGWLPHGIY